MQTVQIASKEAEVRHKFAAMYDARMRNIQFQSKHTQARQVQAERMKLGLEMCYSTQKIYINYRQHSIAIKLVSPAVRDARALAALEAQYAMQGIQKKKSEQGVIYTISTKM